MKKKNNENEKKLQEHYAAIFKVFFTFKAQRTQDDFRATKSLSLYLSLAPYVTFVLCVCFLEKQKDHFIRMEVIV